MAQAGCSRPEPPRPARLSAAACFAVCGAGLGTWTARIPAIEHRLSLGPGLLGAALACCPAGMLLMAQAAPAVISRAGSARAARGAIVLTALTLPTIAAAPDAAWLAGVLFAYGAAFGLLDCAMNTQGCAVQAAYGRPVMAGLHAAYSAGALAGAAAAALAAAAGTGLLPHFTVAAAALAAAGLPGSAHLLHGRGPAAVPPGSSRVDQPAPQAGVLAGLGLVAFAGLMTESTADNWASVLTRAAGHSPAAAALAPAAASCGMMLARLATDQLVRRFGARAVMTAAVLVAAAGQCTASLAGTAPAVVAGYAVLGAGCAPVIPLIYATAGALPGAAPARAVARVTAMGYAGQLTGPAAVGLAAGSIPLGAAVGLPVLLLAAAVLSTAAPRVRPARQGRSRRRGQHHRRRRRPGPG